MASAIRVVALRNFAIVVAILCGTSPVFSEWRDVSSNDVDLLFGLRFDHHQIDKIVVSDGSTRSVSTATDLSDAFGFNIAVLPYVEDQYFQWGFSFSYNQAKFSTNEPVADHLTMSRQMAYGLAMSIFKRDPPTLFAFNLHFSFDLVHQIYDTRQTIVAENISDQLFGARIKYHFGAAPLRILLFGPEFSSATRFSGFIPAIPTLSDDIYNLLEAFAKMAIVLGPIILLLTGAEIGIEGEFSAMTGEILDADASGVGYRMMPYIGVNLGFVHFYIGYPYGTDAYGNNDNNDAGIYYKRSPGVEYILRVNVPF